MEEESNYLVLKIVKIIVKLIIAAMLYACWKGLLPAYFNTMKLVSFIGCVWVTYKELRTNNFITMVFFLMGAVVLNPFVTMDFIEGFTNALYLILAIGVAASAIFDIFKSMPNHEATKFSR